MSNDVNDILWRASISGERYLYSYRTEPIAKSIKRRARLVWGCLTLNPDPYFHEEFRPFRQTETITTVVLPGEEGYEEADSFGPDLIKHVLTTSPWCSLLPKDTQP